MDAKTFHGLHKRVSLGPWPMMAAMPVIGQAAAASKQYGTFLAPNG